MATVAWELTRPYSRTLRRSLRHLTHDGDKTLCGVFVPEGPGDPRADVVLRGERADVARPCAVCLALEPSEAVA